MTRASTRRNRARHSDRQTMCIIFRKNIENDGDEKVTDFDPFKRPKSAFDLCQAIPAKLLALALMFSATYSEAFVNLNAQEWNSTSMRHCIYVGATFKLKWNFSIAINVRDLHQRVMRWEFLKLALLPLQRNRVGGNRTMNNEVMKF